MLTHSLEESLGILDLAFEMLSSLPDLFEAVKVKPHPDTSIAQMRSIAQSKWPEALLASRVSWESGRLESLLDSARMVITAGSSSAMEAICRGVPAIIVGRSAGLTLNPVETVDCRFWELVFDSEQLIQVARGWSPAHPLPRSERVSFGREIRNAYFEPVTPESMKAFLPPFPSDPG
jgi:hypothetical protein